MDKRTQETLKRHAEANQLVVGSNKANLFDAVDPLVDERDALRDGVKEVIRELKNTMGSCNVTLLVDDLEQLLSQSNQEPSGECDE